MRYIDGEHANLIVLLWKFSGDDENLPYVSSIPGYSDNTWEALGFAFISRARKFEIIVLLWLMSDLTVERE